MRKALTINVTTPTNDSKAINVSYVSTTATQADLYDFATALNSLTNNTLVSVELTTVEEITGE